MKYTLFLTRKYLTSRVIAIVAVAAVAGAVFVLMAVLSVMEGFKVTMRDRIRGTLAHVRVEGRTYFSMYGVDDALEKLRAHPRVKAAAPYVDALGLYKSTRSLDVCTIVGIDPLAEADVGEFSNHLLRREEWIQLVESDSTILPDDRQPLTKDEIAYMFSREHRDLIIRNHGLDSVGFDAPPQPIVVGIQAVKRQVMWPGMVVQLSSFTGIDHTPCEASFLVVGVFQTGMVPEDVRNVYMPIGAAWSFLELYDEREEVDDFRLSGVSLRLDDFAYADEVCAELREQVIPELPGGRNLVVSTWEDHRANLLRAVEIEKAIIYAMMLLIVAFAACMIFVILWLMVIEKTRDLGVLASLGATPGGVVKVFTILGMFLTVTGAIIGGLGGWAFTSNINEIHDQIYAMTGWRLFPPDVYYLTELPVVHTQRDLLIIFLPTLFFGFCGSLIPALLAARRDPIGALRHE